MRFTEPKNAPKKTAEAKIIDELTAGLARELRLQKQREFEEAILAAIEKMVADPK